MTAVAKGSSPLTRGKPTREPDWDTAGGLIPAHAGKTLPPGPSRTAPTAHPRSRGENRRDAREHWRAPGSSPLTRGKQGRVHACPQARRLIPAHAGKTASAGMRQPARPAHPRSRGENVSTPSRLEEDGGSSPLTRGNRYSC